MDWPVTRNSGSGNERNCTPFRIGWRHAFSFSIGKKPVERRAQDAAEMKWHRGPTVLEALDQLESPRLPVELPLRFCVQDVYLFDERRIIAGASKPGLRVGTISFSRTRINEHSREHRKGNAAPVK